MKPPTLSFPEGVEDHLGSKLISHLWILKLRPPSFYLLPSEHHMEACQPSEAWRISGARSCLSWKVILELRIFCTQWLSRSRSPPCSEGIVLAFAQKHIKGKVRWAEPSVLHDSVRWRRPSLFRFIKAQCLGNRKGIAGFIFTFAGSVRTQPSYLSTALFLQKSA